MNFARVLFSISILLTFPIECFVSREVSVYCATVLKCTEDFQNVYGKKTPILCVKPYRICSQNKISHFYNIFSGKFQITCQVIQLSFSFHMFNLFAFQIINFRLLRLNCIDINQPIRLNMKKNPIQPMKLVKTMTSIPLKSH